MSTANRTIKRALAYLALEQNTFALLELNTLIEEEPTLWVAYYVRGRANAAAGNYSEAIGDARKAFEDPSRLSKHHKDVLLKTIEQCALVMSRSSQTLQALDDVDASHTPAASKQKKAIVNTGVGRIHQIGKFLLDSQDLVKIGKLVSIKPDNDSTTRRLTTYDSSALEKNRTGSGPGNADNGAASSAPD